MERKIKNDLCRFKKDEVRKNVLLYGMRQIGKTYTVLEFGRENYHNIAYFNVASNRELVDLFKQEKVLDRIILKMSILSNESIFKNETLIIFDNCDNVDFIRKTTILSHENYHVIMITSHQHLLNEIKSEELRYCKMHPMDFEEFLLNSDKKQLIDFIVDSYHTLKPMPFHQMALDLYNDYLVTGGMPEVVKAYFEHEDFYKLEAIKQKIINVYCGDICLCNTSDITRSMEVFNVLPQQLDKENRKFQYGLIKRGSRSKDYDGCINNLVLNGIANRSYRLLEVRSPLSSVKDIESFKLYVNDSGILYTMLHLNRVKLLTDNDVRRCLVENNVANFFNNNGISLYYYQSEGKAEVPFIIQNRIGKIIPIEVADMKLTKAKSLTMFLTRYNIIDAVRITEENFSKKRSIRCVPTYAIFCLKDL